VPKTFYQFPKTVNFKITGCRTISPLPPSPKYPPNLRVPVHFVVEAESTQLVFKELLSYQIDFKGKLIGCVFTIRIPLSVSLLLLLSPSLYLSISLSLEWPSLVDMKSNAQYRSKVTQMFFCS